MLDRIKRRLGLGTPPSTPTPDENGQRMGDLSERLRQMRGVRTTAMGPHRAAPRSADSVEQLSNAARDARYVDRTNEDDVLRAVKRYRSVDDRPS